MQKFTILMRAFNDVCNPCKCVVFIINNYPVILYTVYFNTPRVCTHCVVLHSVCSLTPSVQFNTQCVVLDTVCIFALSAEYYTQWVVLHSVHSFTHNVQFNTQGKVDKKKTEKKLTNVSLVCMYVGRKSEMSVFFLFFSQQK